MFDNIETQNKLFSTTISNLYSTSYVFSTILPCLKGLFISVEQIKITIIKKVLIKNLTYPSPRGCDTYFILEGPWL